MGAETRMNRVLLFLVLLGQSAGAAELQVSPAHREHWAFRPLTNPTPPAVKESAWVRTPIDRFILAALEAKGLQPNPAASPQTLARRISYDLVGLPPAKPYFAGLLDELLASPRYGERWARHWLDVARYADSNGQEGDQDRPNAYHYRDFVIRALNQDLPYDTFLRWQLAGDEFEPDNPLAIAATGFIVGGPHTILDVPMEEEKIRNRFNELDDMISTTGSAMLGLTVGCARCHDHKYDAIPTRDYYRLMNAFNCGNRAEVPLVPLEQARAYRQAQTNWIADISAATNRLEGWLREMQSQPVVSAAEWERLNSAIYEIQSRKPAAPTAHAFADFAAQPRPTHLLPRGDFHIQKEPVELGFLTVLTSTKSPADYWAAARERQRRDDSTQQRGALAEWITDTSDGAGALAARVMVNRVWQHHFGEGLVRTVNDFGVKGERPSHPELLEWLAYEFVKGGWKIKRIHRLIVKSAVYLQDTRFDSAKAAIDPDNRLLWRRRPQRVEAEALRDAMLATSGALNLQMHGPAFKAPIVSEAIQARNLKDDYPKNIKDTPATWRRTIYMFHKRVVQHPLMQTFDAPTAAASCGRRDSTTVAPQALALLNDPFVRARAEDFARRLVREAGPDSRARVWLAWQLALSRNPSNTELEAAVTFLNGAHDRLADLCQAIFAMNEFIYVD
jgi:uncharacterized protein DUF1553/uncharacterized protein DUF1549